MASHKRNGSTRPSAKELQREVDHVALADQPTSEAASIRHQPPADPFKSGTTDAQGMPATGTRWAHINPADAPPPGSRPSLIDKDTALKIYGVSGTPLTSAFLLDLGEYNPLLMGRNAIPTYEKMRRSDDMVAATLAVYRQPLMTAKWDVVEPEPGESGPTVSSTGAGKPTAAKAKEITRFVRDNLFGGLEYQTSMGSWASQSWSSVIYNATLMLDFGCAIHEDVWRVDGDYLRIRNLPQRLPLTYYRWHTDLDGETLIALEQYGYRGNRFENVTIPVEKLCRFTYRQEGANFFGQALSRALYTAWFYKDRFKRIWAVAAEKNMLGVPVWRLVPGFSAEDKNAAFKFVTGLCANELTGAVEPPQPSSDNKDVKSGFRFEIPQAARGNMQSIMQAVTYYDISMARAGLAMFMSSGNTPFGSRSTTKEHADFFLLALQGVADQMRWEIQCSTVRRLVWYNYGQDAPMPQLEVANVQARQLEDMADLLQRLGAAGQVVSDQSLRNYIRKEMALPKETREGLVAIKGETIDIGAPGGPEITGKGGQPIAGGKQPGQAIMNDWWKTQPPPNYLYYPLGPWGRSKEQIRNLDVGDQFLLTKPVRFWKYKPSGPSLQIAGVLSSNEWLKGRFQVRAKEGGVLLADHIAEDA